MPAETAAVITVTTATGITETMATTTVGAEITIGSIARHISRDSHAAIATVSIAIAEVHGVTKIPQKK